MNFYLIAGEASGDLHASKLIREIKTRDPSARFRCWGGDRMKSEGAEVVMHYRDLAFMGFTEVVTHLPTIVMNFKRCRRDILSFRPDAIILIDYPGFNLRIARFAHQHHLRIFYYISPQVWAWKQSRINTIRAYVNRMFVILPFEKEFYARFDYPVVFVGHPLLDTLTDKYPFRDKASFISSNGLDNRPVISLLPGSRRQEISRILKIMLLTVKHFPEYQFVIAGLSSVPASFYNGIFKGYDVKIVYDQTYDLLKHSHAAVVSSGTATLETAIIGTPQVICYRGGYLSYQIAKRVVKVRHIGLVNLIMDRIIAPELIQNDFTVDNLADNLKKCICDDNMRSKMADDYHELKMKLGGSGASGRTAAFIMGEMKSLHMTLAI